MSFHRYLRTARRYRLVLVLALLLVWAAGLTAAFEEYTTTFEADATIWVQRASSQIPGLNGSDPTSLATSNSPGAEQAELFSQLLQTSSFLEEVVAQTPLKADYEAAKDKQRYLDDVRKRFRADVLGTNLIRISFRAKEPAVTVDAVKAALAARDARVKNSAVASAAAAQAFYQKEYDVAQGQVTAAQKALDSFNQSHSGRLDAAEEYTQNQLRVAVELARARLDDLRARVERGSVSTALLDLAQSVEFNVIDQPRVQTTPSGGTRSAATIGGAAVAGGIGLALFALVLLTLLDDRVDSAIDLARFASVPVFAIVPRIPERGREHRLPLRDELVARFQPVARAEPPADVRTA